jgi:hypothetical protein
VGIKPRLCSCVTLAMTSAGIFSICLDGAPRVWKRLRTAVSERPRSAAICDQLSPAARHSATRPSSSRLHMGRLSYAMRSALRRYPQASDNASQCRSTGLIADVEAPPRRRGRSGAYRCAATRPTVCRLQKGHQEELPFPPNDRYYAELQRALNRGSAVSCSMRTVRSSPIAPSQAGDVVYLVLDDFSAIGLVYREADRGLMMSSASSPLAWKRDGLRMSQSTSRVRCSIACSP